MTELLTANQMRALENAAIESGKVSGLELMEHAGRGVVDAIFEEWPELAKCSHRALVLCGPGNNGGDGFVVARLLHLWGWDVEVFLYGDPETLPPDAKANYKRWREIGAVNSASANLDLRQDLLVDALFGTGLSRPIEDSELCEVLRLFDGATDARAKSDVGRSDAHVPPRTVAIDVPSGICADSGRVLGGVPEHGLRCGRAMLTVTFHRHKLGHVLQDGEYYSGRLVVKDIGLPPQEQNPPGIVLSAHQEPQWLKKVSADHKYTHGHALVLSGGPGKTGAARLAARAALRIGAGLVTLGVPGAAQMEVASQITALMLKRTDDDAALSQALEDERINALCLGPGFGTGTRERALILAALRAKRPTVLDADALSILFFDEGDALFGKLHDTCVLTPHGGEFARMFPDIAEKLNACAINGPAFSKVDATREAAKRAGCVVLYKGPDTVIAAPDGRCAINWARYERAAPWLATAGSGDVLAGFITGLLARGFDPMRAAEVAAWLHVECARSFGSGMIAEDISDELPKVFRSLTI
ncbi:NAD(P)H-hydrate dehydratase [uncultured Roseobacter sp.]|uniref:NAD(P)H-hydrate dehydratase n=1 Tax=uncultured Roseobacter sp. TaxID=114847 RepID=UPI00261F2164|nr:NAD(P)H-hydrate dehydratase [uncultured Roseobacter sp.]